MRALPCDKTPNCDYSLQVAILFTLSQSRDLFSNFQAIFKVDVWIGLPSPLPPAFYAAYTHSRVTYESRGTVQSNMERNINL